MPSSLALKLVGGLAAALMLFLLIADRNRWKGKAERYNQESIGLWYETRDASDNPKLERKDARQQIKALGESNARLKAAIVEQNAAVARMGAETARQQVESARASEKAVARAKGAEAAAARLLASSRQNNAPCEPSAALKETWR